MVDQIWSARFIDHNRDTLKPPIILPVTRLCANFKFDCNVLSLEIVRYLNSTKSLEDLLLNWHCINVFDRPFHLINWLVELWVEAISLLSNFQCYCVVHPESLTDHMVQENRYPTWLIRDRHLFDDCVVVLPADFDELAHGLTKS